MRINKYLIFIPIFLLAYFTACNTPGPNSNSSNNLNQFQKPYWAVDQPGYITFNSPTLNSQVVYNKNSGSSYSIYIQYQNNIFFDKSTKLNLEWQIFSSVGYVNPSSGSLELSQGVSNGNIVEPSIGQIGPITLKIGSGLQSVQNLNIVFNYTLSNVETRIEIPMLIKAPSEGESQQTEYIPVYYSSSPIVPSNNAELTLLPGSQGQAILQFSIQDDYDCLNEQNNIQPTVNIKEFELVNEINGQAIDLLNGNSEVTCDISGNQLLLFNGVANITCYIPYSVFGQYQNNVLTSGISAYLYMVLTYNCQGQLTYNVPVSNV